MTDDLPDTRDPIRRIAHETAADATPIRLTDGVTTFDEFAAVTADLADDIEHALRAEVPA